MHPLYCLDANFHTCTGKLCIVIFAAWGGSNGGIIAGLAVCTIMQTIVGCCSDLMQDFKTGFLVSLLFETHHSACGLALKALLPASEKTK